MNIFQAVLCSYPQEAFGSIEQSRIMPKNVCSDNNSGGVLMITSKANIEQWERCARNYYSSSFHSYTAPLSQRRKFGATRLSTFDIVMSTLGVLTAKECSIPAFMLSDDAGYDSNEDLDKNDDGSRNSDCDIGGENWLRRRRCSNLTMEYVLYISYDNGFVFLMYCFLSFTAPRIYICLGGKKS